MLQQAAKPVRQPDLTAGQLGPAILLECAAEIDAGFGRIMSSANPDGPHAVRVSLRRLRTALKALKPIMDAKSCNPLRDRAAEAFGRLGPLRTADVLVIGLREFLPAADVGRLRARATRLRKLARLMLTQSGADQITSDLRDLLAGNDWHRSGKAARALCRIPAREFSRSTLDRVWQAACDKGHGLAGQDAASRHEFRKSIKSLRYTMEFFKSVWNGGKYRNFRSRLSLLQDNLGVLNDLSEAESNPELPAAAIAAFRTAADGAEQRAAETWKALRRAGPFW